MLFKQQISPNRIRYLLYADGKKISTLTSHTRVIVSSDKTSFELINGSVRQVLRATGDHIKWINTISSAVCDCIIAESLSRPLTLQKVTKCVEILRSDFKNVETNEILEVVELGNVMKEVVMMMSFVSKKDPGFHKGSLREHCGLLELVRRGDGVEKLADFGEYKKLKDYVEGIYNDGEEGEKEEGGEGDEALVVAHFGCTSDRAATVTPSSNDGNDDDNDDDDNKDGVDDCGDVDNIIDNILNIDNLADSNFSVSR